MQKLILPISITLIVLGPCACTASVSTLWAISPAHVFFLACSEYKSSLMVHQASIEPPPWVTVYQGFISQAAFSLWSLSPSVKECCPCPLETNASPGSKLRTGGGLGWHRAMEGFFHGFECLSCWISSQLCHV